MESILVIDDGDTSLSLFGEILQSADFSVKSESDLERTVSECRPGYILDLMLEAATAQRRILEYLSFISKLPAMKLYIVKQMAESLVSEIIGAEESVYRAACNSHRPTARGSTSRENCFPG